MKKLTLLLFLFACFVGCSKKESIINGRLPNASFDNEWMYLIPFKNASKKTVDSVLIRNSSFQFRLKPQKQNQIFILRIKPLLLRLKLQNILIISEPGIIDVWMDKHSLASGTPLNLILQQWKNEKHISDSIYYSVYRKYKKETNELEKAQYQAELKEILEKYQIYADSLAEENKDNAVGQFIHSLSKNN